MDARQIRRQIETRSRSEFALLARCEQAGCGAHALQRVGFGILPKRSFFRLHSHRASSAAEKFAIAERDRQHTTSVRSPELCDYASCSHEIHRQIDVALFMKKTLAHQLADYACALRFEDLSKHVVHEVKRRVLDSLGCALGAWSEEPCAIARKVASDFSAKRGSTIVGTNHKAPPDWAAFANGCCIRYFDYNDTYLSKEPAHPSDNISAALSVAESVGASGRELIAAIALAYEVQCRLCDAASIRARGWDHVTYGAFSTALASAKLMKL